MYLYLHFKKFDINQFWKRNMKYESFNRNCKKVPFSCSKLSINTKYILVCHTATSTWAPSENET